MFFARKRGVSPALALEILNAGARSSRKSERCQSAPSQADLVNSELVAPKHQNSTSGCDERSCLVKSASLLAGKKKPADTAYHGSSSSRRLLRTEVATLDALGGPEEISPSSSALVLVSRVSRLMKLVPSTFFGNLDRTDPPDLLPSSDLSDWLLSSQAPRITTTLQRPSAHRPRLCKALPLALVK